MKFNLSRFIFALTVALAAFSFASPEATAQSEADLKWYEGGTYHTQSEVDAMYHRNAQRPLGGLFAPSFTRTLTLLGGVNFLTQETTDNFSSTIPSLTPETDFLSIAPNSVREADSTGYALSFAFGRRHSHKLRSEIEVAVRGNDINEIASFGVLTDPTQDGNVTTTSLMKNFIIDLNNDSRFTPYIGVGLGLSFVDVEFGEASSLTGDSTGGDDDTLFSYQAIGGVATELTSVADFIVEYRFLGTAEGDFQFDGVNQSLDYNTSSLFLGLKLEY